MHRQGTWDAPEPEPPNWYRDSPDFRKNEKRWFFSSFPPLGKLQ